MQEHSVKVNGTHVSIVSLLDTVLVILKVLGKISLSWFLVVVIVFVTGFLGAILDARNDYRKSGF